MAVYWLTFRLADDATYAQRYDGLIKAVDNIATKWWVESSSFILFEAASDLDGVAGSVKRAINSGIDVALIGMPDFKSARAIGAIKNQTLFELMPFAKKV